MSQDFTAVKPKFSCFYFMYKWKVREGFWTEVTPELPFNSWVIPSVIPCLITAKKGTFLLILCNNFGSRISALRPALDYTQKGNIPSDNFDRNQWKIPFVLRVKFGSTFSYGYHRFLFANAWAICADGENMRGISRVTLIGLLRKYYAKIFDKCINYTVTGCLMIQYRRASFCILE